MKLSEARLYGIIDLGYVPPEGCEEMARLLCEGGVEVLQLRAKTWDDLQVEEMAQRLGC